MQYIAFQTDFEAKSLAVYPLAEGVADELKRESAAAEKSGNYSRICAYLALFCSYYSEEKTAAAKIGDYSYLIREFFTENYAKELTLSQLAGELRTSVRQAERLVRRYTGRSFCDELLYTRMAMADALMKDTDMSLREIAECVGYGSYSGFWKAKKRYDERKGK